MVRSAENHGPLPGIALTDATPPAPPSTLIEVARHAGVSPSTVSRILNGTAKVSDDKRLAVLAAIDKVSFAPNQMAQGLKKAFADNPGLKREDIFIVSEAQMASSMRRC